MLRARITETPIIVDIPEARVYGVNGSECNEYRFVRTGLVDPVDAQGHVEDDRCEVFAAV